VFIVSPFSLQTSTFHYTVPLLASPVHDSIYISFSQQLLKLLYSVGEISPSYPNFHILPLKVTSAVQLIAADMPCETKA
jgi:hypothetical protein